MYAAILNFETGGIDALDLCNKPEKAEVEEYIEDTLSYSLENCEWMIIEELPIIKPLNY